MNEPDLDLYLGLITKQTIETRTNAKYQGGTDMSKQLDQWAVQAMAHHKHEWTTHPRIVGNSMEYFGVCRLCGEFEA